MVDVMLVRFPDGWREYRAPYPQPAAGEVLRLRNHEWVITAAIEDAQERLMVTVRRTDGWPDWPGPVDDVELLLSPSA